MKEKEAEEPVTPLDPVGDVGALPAPSGGAPSPFHPIAREEQWHGIQEVLPHPHPLQSWTWGAFKARWGWSMMPLVLGDVTRPQASALVLKRAVPRLPFSVLYVPKGPNFDYNDTTLVAQVLAQLEALARRERAIFVKIDPDVISSRGPDPDDPIPNPVGDAWRARLQARGWRFSNDQIQFRNTVELDLTQPEEELLAAMKSKTRYNIRYARRKGVKVTAVGPEAFPTIMGIYETTAERNEFAIRPPGYYLDAWQSFVAAGLAQAFLATYEETPLGAVIAVKYGQRAIYMYGASNNKERQRMPNYLLQWEAIRWAQEQGCTVYDMWGAPDTFVADDPLWGVWRFKSGFNGDVVRHIGAWDFAPRRFWYWLYTVVIPRYIAALRRI